MHQRQLNYYMNYYTTLRMEAYNPAQAVERAAITRAAPSESGVLLRSDPLGALRHDATELCPRVDPELVVDAS